jgi:hypothetical protein
MFANNNGNMANNGKKKEWKCQILILWKEQLPMLIHKVF